MPDWLRPITRMVAVLVTGCLALSAGLAGTAAEAATIEIAGPAGASVSINGRPAGFLPLPGPLELETGRHAVVCELPGHEPFRQDILLDGPESRLRLQVRLEPFSRRTAVASNLLLAGLGQQYLGRRTRGVAFSAAEIGGLATMLYGELKRSDLRKDYLLLQDKYDRAINADEIARLRAEASQAYANMEDKEKVRDTGLAVAAGAVVLSMLDAFVFFPEVVAGAGPAPLQTALGDGPATGLFPQPAVHAGVRLTF